MKKRCFGYALVLATGLLAPGCIERRAFTCTDAEECTLGDTGHCEPQGSCSYPDGECPTRQRYEELAPGGLGGQCVEFRPCVGDEDCERDADQGLCQTDGGCSFQDETCDSQQRYDDPVPDVGGTCVPIEITCPAYCARFPVVCGEMNVNPYTDETHCLAECAQWPTGTEDDSAGDSLACRLFSLSQVEDWNPVVNCVRAGQNGGDVCRPEQSPTCAVYCETFLMTCNPALADAFGMAPWSSRDECQGVCQSWYPGYVAETGQDSLGCRLYHTVAATMLPANAPMEDRLGLCLAGSRSGGDICVLPMP